MPDQIQDFILTTNLPLLTAQLKQFGFLYIMLDLEGYRSGKLNDVVLSR